MSEDDRVVLDCGKTIEELSEYLDAGRAPYDPDIETCPECLNALDALARVGALSRDLVADDASRLPPPPDSWFDALFATIQAELKAGRSFPIHHPDPRVKITVSEGAVRTLLRATGDALDGVVVGRTQILGKAEIPGAPVEINISASVAYGEPFAAVAGTLRSLVYDALTRHTELNVAAVNVTVEDVHGGRSSKEKR
ncbi:Asp23/Gls24 family envelope stress response protein [Microbacterium invictum]|uniref:Asp23/Gls24 family envelope stress response protein n=1 Tax=Microbacterium invictum TaxID=515415 RepID=A0ABZ0V8Z6_9MICO|nr:Asp23/Gls24 family envelope stress response protein [Microbacterium invictum]WQB69944.1 Asp23/Gls24 family envelope stress response protein [Microbacterium invictum]